MAARSDFLLERVIGIRGEVGVCVVGENEIAYAAFNRVVLHNLETNCQRFIETGRGVSFLLANYARTLLVVAFKSDSTLECYDIASLQCKSKLVHKLPSNDVYHLSFSHDSTKMLTLTKLPEWTMTVFSVNEKKAGDFASLNLSNIRGGILRADISSVNNSIVSVLGSNDVQIFQLSTKMNSGFFQLPLHLDDEQSYTTQVWLKSGDLLIGTSDRKILVIGEQRKVKQCIEIQSLSRSMIGYPQGGCAVGCEDGSLILLQRTRDECFVCERVLKLTKASIVSLGVMKTKDDANNNSNVYLCLTESNELIEYPLDGKPSLVQPSHKGSIKDLIPTFGASFLDTCSWMPRVAVGGYDGNLIIFNYITTEILLTHQFEDSILGISFHPFGQHILLSTLSGGVCMCSIRDKLEVIWKVVDHVHTSIVKFTPSGDRFCRLHEHLGQQKVVQVHDFHSEDYTTTTTLRASKPIVSIDIGPYHDELVSIGIDSIVLWNIRTGVVLKRINLLSPAVLSGCFEWNDRAAYIITGDNVLRKVPITDEANMNIVDTKCDHEDNQVLAVLPSGTLICSNNRELKALQFHANEWVTRALTRVGQVSSACLCFQTGRLFIASDGCLAILKDNKKHITSHHSIYHPLDGVLLTSRHSLGAVDNEITEIKKKMESLKADHTSRLEIKKADAEFEMERLNNAHQQKLEVILAQTSILQKQIDELGASLNLELESVAQRGTDEREALAETLEKKLAKENDNIQDFNKRCAEMKRAYDVEVIQAQDKHAHDIEVETHQFHAKMTEANCNCEAIIENIDTLRLQCTDQLMKIEDKAERDIEILWVNHHRNMKSFKQSNQLLHNEKSILQQKYNTMLDDLKELQEQIATQEESHRDAFAAISKLNYEIKTTRQQIVDKELIIATMEQDMSHISQSNLEHEHENKDIKERMRLLEHDLMPIEKELQMKETEHSKLSAIIKGNTNELSHLSVELDGAKIKHKQAMHQLACLERECSEKDRRIKALESQLFINNDSALSLSRADKHAALKQCLLSLRDEFIDNRQHPSAKNDRSEAVKSLEKKINTMRLTIEQKKRTHAKDMTRLKRENAVLKKVSEPLFFPFSGVKSPCDRTVDLCRSLNNQKKTKLELK